MNELLLVSLDTFIACIVSVSRLAVYIMRWLFAPPVPRLYAADRYQGRLCGGYIFDCKTGDIAGIDRFIL